MSRAAPAAANGEGLPLLDSGPKRPSALPPSPIRYPTRRNQGVARDGGLRREERAPSGGDSPAPRSRDPTSRGCQVAPLVEDHRSRRRQAGGASRGNRCLQRKRGGARGADGLTERTGPVPAPARHLPAMRTGAPRTGSAPSEEVRCPASPGSAPRRHERRAACPGSAPSPSVRRRTQPRRAERRPVGGEAPLGGENTLVDFQRRPRGWRSSTAELSCQGTRPRRLKKP